MEDPSNREDTNVRVAVRCRPFNTKEKNNGEVSCVRIETDHIVLVDPHQGGEEHSFAFDVIFDENSLQTSLWDSIGIPILNKAFNGYNGTIFAYGVRKNIPRYAFKILV
jgi:kinesin family protein 1/kinesin family protein 3/17